MSSRTKRSAAREAFTFAFPLRVRWAEVDRQGIVFNPNYFVYADIASTEYFRALGFAYPAAFEALGSDLFAVSAEGRFHASARFDELLEIAFRTAHLGRTSIAFEITISRDRTVLFEGILTYVNADLTARQPQPLPADLVTRILEFERVAPSRRPA